MNILAVIQVEYWYGIYKLSSIGIYLFMVLSASHWLSMMAVARGPYIVYLCM